MQSPQQPKPESTAGSVPQSAASSAGTASTQEVRGPVDPSVSKREGWTLRDRLSLVFEGIVAVAAVLGLLTIGYLVRQTDEMHEQTRKLSETLDIAASQAIYSHMIELDKTLLDESNKALLPYFSGDPAPASKDDNYARAVALADMHLDVFDAYLAQQSHISPELIDRVAWETYMADTFGKSPILCQRLNEVQLWYSIGFVEFAKGPCGDTIQLKER